MGLPLIPLALGALSQGAGIFSTSRMNQKTREWNEHMYERQRQDSLADWAMMNEYQHPSQQMARLREAGLNPHLVYGHGGVPGATSMPRSASPGSWTPRPVPTDMLPMAMGFMDWQVKEAQLDNVRAATTVRDQDAVLRAAQVIKTLTDTQKGKVDVASKQFDLEMKNTLKEISVEAAKAGLQKTLMSTQVMFDENERRAAMQAPNLQIAAEKILTMRLDRVHTSWQISEIKEKIELLRKDTTLRQLDIDLKKDGVQPGDAIYWRVLSRLLGDDFMNRPVDKAIRGANPVPSSDPMGHLRKLFSK